MISALHVKMSKLNKCKKSIDELVVDVLDKMSSVNKKYNEWFYDFILISDKRVKNDSGILYWNV